MEKVLEDFAFKLTTENEELRNFRLSQYKFKNHTSSDQESRRQIYLSRQKCKRDKILDHRRGILEVVEAIDNVEEEAVYKPTNYVPGFTPKVNDLANSLMLSEWMIEPPYDLEDNWLMLACPQGIRVLLVAKKGMTKTYNKMGKLHKYWKSALPGGNDDHDFNKSGCVLDCIWSDVTKSIYILDILAWGNHPVTECDLEFRDSWIKSKYTEYALDKMVPGKNEYPMYLVSKYSCDIITFNNFMSNWPPFPDNKPCIDGFLFYHKHGHYVGGTSPLVVWLYPYMVNEVIGKGIHIHEHYMNMKPSNYVDQKSFIQDFEQKQALKKMYKDKHEKKFNFQKNNQQYKLNSNDVIVFGSDDMNFNSPQNMSKKKKKRKSKSSKRASNSSMELDVKVENIDEMNNDSFGDEIEDKNKCNLSTDVDSAVSSMDDSILEDHNVIVAEC